MGGGSGELILRMERRESFFRPTDRSIYRPNDQHKETKWCCRIQDAQKRQHVFRAAAMGGSNPPRAHTSSSTSSKQNPAPVVVPEQWSSFVSLKEAGSACVQSHRLHPAHQHTVPTTDHPKQLQLEAKQTPPSDRAPCLTTRLSDLRNLPVLCPPVKVANIQPFYHTKVLQKKKKNSDQVYTWFQK